VSAPTSPFADLRDAHHALFLAPGLPRPRPLPIALPQDARIRPGLAFLRAVSTGMAGALSGHVGVIGGGDVAVDAARSALRLGAEKVTLCCVEARTEMPAHTEEVEAARQEGVEVLDRVTPASVVADVRGLRLDLLGVATFARADDGSIRIEADSSSRRTLRLSHLVYAVGQQADLSFLPEPLAEESRLRNRYLGADGAAGGVRRGRHHRQLQRGERHRRRASARPSASMPSCAAAAWRASRS